MLSDRDAEHLGKAKELALAGKVLYPYLDARFGEAVASMISDYRGGEPPHKLMLHIARIAEIDSLKRQLLRAEERGNKIMQRGLDE